jgi:hypothetical protein
MSCTAGKKLEDVEVTTILLPTVHMHHKMNNVGLDCALGDEVGGDSQPASEPLKRLSM